MKLLVALAVAGTALGLTACGGVDVEQGTVVAKHYTPAHTDTWLMPMTTGCNKYGCTTILVPQTTFRADEWELELKDCSLPHENQPCPTGWIDVDFHTYVATFVGDFYRPRTTK